MVLTLKRWKSRSSPGIIAGGRAGNPFTSQRADPSGAALLAFSNAAHGAAGWSSPVARQAHNLKVVGSNPTPATTLQSSASQPPAPLLASCRDDFPGATSDCGWDRRVGTAFYPREGDVLFAFHLQSGMARLALSNLFCRRKI